MTCVSPEVEVRGPGEPAVAVVGGVHGDEPSGARAVRRLVERAEDLQRAVKFVVANPPALEAGERYLDADLNRSFPGDPGGNREERLAAQVCEATADLPTLSLHATHSQPEPLALVDRHHLGALRLAADLPVDAVVDHSRVIGGALTSCGPAVTVEAGCQGTEAATDAAEGIGRAFLRATGALPGAPLSGETAFYALREAIEKPPAGDYDLRVGNFQRVPAGTTYARAGDRELVAEEAFYPVLMSECGYEDVFGYTADYVGATVEEARRRFQAGPAVGAGNADPAGDAGRSTEG